MMKSMNEATNKEGRTEKPKSSAPLKNLQSHLVSFGERVTYTFAYGHEVGSVHFDRNRGEIFFKGHNIRNMDVEPWQWQLFDQMRSILRGDSEGEKFAEAYGRVLDKILSENKK